ncbi:MAG: NAD-dependent epimerase/dehydratase family protein [Gammaproteobacteria bacterium]|nr:NAD-dependent epimerase/dehydratase family protein [Gammaproteobacteria bacterium]MDH3534284.1 NAD-dependent epimerase/dehydratase family protein [Gammaproteobacteria bacterium]
MKVLVTGGSGYFGELLCLQLLEKGHEVLNLDVNKNVDEDPRIAFVEADIRDYDRVAQACSGVDVVYHNVAQVPLAKDRHLFETVNKNGTENILKAALEKGVPRLVYTSSSAVFGIPQQNPVLESTQPTPMEAYGKAKYDGELLCREYSLKGLDVAIVRPRTILGHGRLGIFQILFEWVFTGKNIPVLNGGNNIYQFVHAEDLGNACMLASEKPGFNIYNCGAGEFGSMKDMLQTLCRHANTGSRVKSLPMWPVVVGMKITSVLGLSPLGAYHAMMYGRPMYFDISKARTELGWNPRYSNEEMIIEAYDWYVSNRDRVLTNTSGSHHKKKLKQGVLKIVSQLL